MIFFFLFSDIVFIGVGDIMMGSSYQGTLPREKGASLLNNCKEIFSKGDIIFGNLEGPLTDYNIPEKNADFKTKFIFRTPKEFAINLKDARFNVLSLANNHSMDFGRKGIDDTKEILRNLGIKFTSRDGEVAEFDIDGVKIAVIGFSFGFPPRSIVYPDEPLSEIDSLSRYYDILIVSVHWGKEGENAMHTRDETEYFLGENRGNLLRFSHCAIDNGADLVIGHGPHIPRGMEIYKGKLIAYSLGNFCTYGGISVDGLCGMAPILEVKLGKKGEFIEGYIHSFIQKYLTPPYYDKENRAFKLIKKLSFEDFPETSPIFDEGNRFYSR